MREMEQTDTILQADRDGCVEGVCPYGENGEGERREKYLC